jgi:hypothetical protein
MLRRVEVAMKLIGLIGLGMMLGATAPTEIEAGAFGTLCVVVSWIVLILIKEFK